MTSLLKSATTATEYVDSPALTLAVLLIISVCSTHTASLCLQMHCSGLAWNPEVATQLVLASEDDRMPVIQMWDLRFATSPLKIFENHTR